MNHLKVCGCICFAQVPKEKKIKLDEISEKCIFVCYSSMSKGYRLYNLKTKKIIISRDVILMKKVYGIGRKTRLKVNLSRSLLCSKIQVNKLKIKKNQSHFQSKQLHHLLHLAHHLHQAQL